MQIYVINLMFGLFRNHEYFGSLDLFYVKFRIVGAGLSVSQLQEDQKLVFKTYYHLMQVKSIAECSAIFSTFIKLPFVI